MSDQPKTIFVNRFFYPDHSATSQMLSDLAFALANQGYRVKVVTARLTYDGAKTLARREVVGDVDIVRVRTTAFGRDRLLGRSFDYLSFYIMAFSVLLWQVRRGDVVIAMTDPPLLSVVVGPVAFLKRALFVNWLQDLFPEVAMALGSRRAVKIVLSALRVLRNSSLRQARANIVIGDLMAEKLRGFGVRSDRIEVVANWADGQLIKPLAPDRNPLRETLGLGSAFVAGYSGNLGRAHDEDTILGAIEHVARLGLNTPFVSLQLASLPNPNAEESASAHDFQWVFTGGGVGMDRLRREVNRLGLNSVIFQAYQPRENLSAGLSLPDVHLVSLRPELEGLIVPSKFYGVVAAGRPVIFIGDRRGELGRMILSENIGAVVEPRDPAALAHAVIDLARDPALRVEQGRRARALFERRFDFGYAHEAWREILDKLLNPAQSPKSRRAY